MIFLARYCGRESEDEKVLRILGVARFDPVIQENAVPGLKNICRLPLHFSFTNDLGTSSSAFGSKKEAGKKVSFPFDLNEKPNEGGRGATDFVWHF